MAATRPRRRAPRALRESLYQRSGGRCEREGCGASLELDSFHVAHLRSHRSGGALVESNAAAWCAACNLRQGGQDAADTRVEPRAWQAEALPLIAQRIRERGAATVAAAPGAGKTVFAALVFEELRAAGLVDRMVVLAPRRSLVRQWQAAVRSARHLELRAHAALEGRGQDGVVATYQSLNAASLGVHLEQAARARTLLILDEVHHVGEPARGERAAWARAVAELAGEVEGDLNVAGVLNLSGTPWRSTRGERISTVRYRLLEDGRLESLIDYEIGSRELIAAGELRPVSLYRLDGRVELYDRAGEEELAGNIADLDERPARAVLAGLARQDGWREAFVAAILDRLAIADRSLEHAKALIVANRQEDARLFQQEVNRQMRRRGLRPLAHIATSDGLEPGRVLEEFRGSKRPGVLCTVDMAGEGYDCPDIAVVGFASNKLTSLYVRQTIARGMRVTEAERERGVIPAAVVVPDVPVLADALAELLAPLAHHVEPGEEEPASIEESLGTGEELVRLPRFEITSLEPADLLEHSLWGETFRLPTGEVEAAEAAAERAGLPRESGRDLLVLEQKGYPVNPFDPLSPVERPSLAA